MVVVVGRIGEDAVEYGLRHLALHLRQEVLIVGEGLLFGIGEAVETHVLQGAAARAGGESVVHCRLSGYLSPYRSHRTSFRRGARPRSPLPG